MLPKPPPREGSLGFLYMPPYRLYGTSVAGEATCLVVPELDLGFDIGACPRPMLPSKYLALSHGHMDHSGCLAYFFSQRRFQGMGTGKVICDARIANDIHKMMAGFVDLERQRTPYELFPLAPDGQIEIKNHVFLRGFPTEHTCPSFGYSVYEKRSKLKPEYAEFPQEKLRELKERGVEITRTIDIPILAYLGDTQPGPHLLREDVRKAPIVICECTFFEPDHKERAKVGMHMHADDVVEWLGVLECRHLVLIHISRRTDLAYARRHLTQLAGEELSSKVLFLMDHRASRLRYERQMAEDAPGEAGAAHAQASDESAEALVAPIHPGVPAPHPAKNRE